MKKVLVIGWLGLILITIGGLFWYNFYVYSLPTPVPKNYVAVSTGRTVQIGSGIKRDPKKPLLLHFFNPECPCSKFNIKHFKELVQEYSSRADFVVVLLNEKKFTTVQVAEKFDLSVPVVADPALAVKCGVYSTPQAAIIDASGKLFYRGNYNSSRYCTDTKTEYARIALDALFKNQSPSQNNPLAVTAYGCSLPKGIR